MKKLLLLIAAVAAFLSACGPTRTRDNTFTQNTLGVQTPVQLLPLPQPVINLGKGAKYLAEYDAQYFTRYDSILATHFGQRNIMLQKQAARFVLEVKSITVEERRGSDNAYHNDGSPGPDVDVSKLNMLIACTITDTQTNKKQDFTGGITYKTKADTDLLTDFYGVERGTNINGNNAMTNTLDYLRGMSVKFIKERSDRH